jgi:hypothetical protein
LYVVSLTDLSFEPKDQLNIQHIITLCTSLGGIATASPAGEWIKAALWSSCHKIDGG